MVTYVMMKDVVFNLKDKIKNGSAIKMALPFFNSL